MIFKQAYSPSSTCTPSRFSLLTGTHAFRNKISVLGPNGSLCVPTNELTLPKLFKKAGYSTAVIGKWHLGLGKGQIDWNGAIKPGPLEIGFDYSFILPSTNDRVPTVYLENHYVFNLNLSDPLYVSTKNNFSNLESSVYPNGKKNREAMTYYKSTHGHNNSVINGIGRIGYMKGGESTIWDDELMADELVDRARKYITQNKDTPFFMFFSSQDIHVPRTPHPRFQGQSSLGYRGDAMVQLDWTTGQIMNILKEHGISDNTIVIFSSDNGPTYDDGYDDGTTIKRFSKEIDRGHDASGICSGGKYQIYEGGVRVPFIISWPNKIKPGISDAIINQIDLIASMSSLLEIQLNKGDAPDSRNILPAFLGKDNFGLPFTIIEAKHPAIRYGKWKYIPKRNHGHERHVKKNTPALYNLNTDPQENNNLIAEHLEVAERMKSMLTEIVKSDGIRNFVE